MLQFSLFKTKHLNMQSQTNLKKNRKFKVTNGADEFWEQQVLL